ncbi:hypothetical protein BOTCAL_0445g00080 [Botryotinia calthae]|uniref:Uncharacterized protein n=1 Tax=Botryotinia calthae TaxID=38488 RepID=A0A4Y8CND3_9HELO|nr:hypothetical protein BOTCAL_0445g00080 [Botryotinia calthae]
MNSFALHIPTPTLSNVFYEYFNNKFGNGSEDSKESNIEGGGNDNSNIGNANATNGITTQHTLNITNTDDNITAAYIPEEAEMKYISKEAFEEIQKDCVMHCPWPWSNIKSKRLYPPTQQHK